MRCDQAQLLFDAYLDGELSPSLQRELGAHRVSCSECRRELALLEVAGQMIATDDEPVGLQDGFTDRLMACVDEGHHRDTRWRRMLYVGAPMAAAAVVCLAFLGFFDPGGGPTLVAGKKQSAKPTLSSNAVVRNSPELDDVRADHENAAVLGASGIYDAKGGVETAGGTAHSTAVAVEYDRLVDDIRCNVNNKKHHVESLRDSLDLTIRQWLDMLNGDATPPTSRLRPRDNEDAVRPLPNETESDRTGDIEDL